MIFDHFVLGTCVGCSRCDHFPAQIHGQSWPSKWWTASEWSSCGISSRIDASIVSSDCLPNHNECDCNTQFNFSEIYFEKPELSKPLAVRDARASHVGKLVSMRGIVLRSTDVKPLVSVITYTCDTCGNETYQPVTGRSFQPAVNCPSRECVESKANGRLQMQNRGSKMLKFQELRIQELVSFNSFCTVLRFH